MTIRQGKWKKLCFSFWAGSRTALQDGSCVTEVASQGKELQLALDLDPFFKHEQPYLLPYPPGRIALFEKVDSPGHYALCMLVFSLIKQT